MNKAYKILFLGDFHFGESYKEAGAKILEEHGYTHATKYLLPFIDEADHTVFNLESPIVNPKTTTSDLRGKKSYIHWADPAGTIDALKDLGVDCVSLANNHTMDYGVPGIVSSFDALTKAGISYFGAGLNNSESGQPYQISIPAEHGGGKINVFGCFQYSRVHDKDYEFYARAEKAGAQSLSQKSQLPAIHPQEINIAFPHWGSNYKWKSEAQERLAQRLVHHGFDLVLGHGSHAVQEIESLDSTPVVYSIGNGMFQSGGRYKAFEESDGIVPFGFWTMIEVAGADGVQTVTLKLYPVTADNRSNGFQPRPVDAQQFQRLLDALGEKNNGSQNLQQGSDALGSYLSLEVAARSFEQPEKLDVDFNPLLNTSIAPHIYTDAGTKKILFGMNRFSRSSGPETIALAAAQDGATLQWLDGRRALVTAGEQRFLLLGHKGTESFVGARTIGDKLATYELLDAAGVNTPKTALVASAEEAVGFQRSVGQPVVLKPRNGQKGNAVSVNLLGEEEIGQAFLDAAAYGEVIVQEQIIGTAEFRCLTSPEECVSVVRRVLPWVQGDGVSTIEQLIVKENLRRQLYPSTYDGHTPTSGTIERYLNSQNLSLDTVLERGQRRQVLNFGGLSSGAEPFEVFEDVSDSVKDSASAAVAAIPGLGWGGVDIMLDQAGEPYVIEINSDAGITGSQFPFYGVPKNVGAYLYELHRDHRAAIDPEQFPIANPQTAISGQQKLSSLLRASYRASGYEVQSVGKRLTQVRDNEGQSKWLLGCATSDDLETVQRISGEHFTIRKLLRIGKVLVPRARVIRSEKDKSFFTLGTADKVVIARRRDAWGNSENQVLTADELENLSPVGRPYVQAMYAGERYLVCATPDQTLAILADRESNDADVQKLGAIAQKATASIPKLRWGAWNVLVSAGRTMVEGLSTDPLLNEQQKLVFGDLGKVLNAI
ncbi:hypothetical protein AUR04nite_06990 [Glutamicibacter uratoxydans]|uniref:ATP-grasp domain-containing protein n=1 Tax=Glutamicibacter uratoxydans TaxID=43667 RepID=A0A4Y4DKL4_GLUUR|nr:CapA family protein [Glutamicibacter uratoxydans]GED05167.1 hypothetical protein AUR04nite_06990 [Glutamicibacter uratoxydans]